MLQTLFEFPAVKLLDYNNRVEELETGRDPFGIIVVIHLKTLETSKDTQARLNWKTRLAKALYLKEFSREDIINLLRFLDWLMVLPKELESKFQEEMKTFEEGRKVAYITPWEEMSIAKGMEKGMEKGKAQNLYDLCIQNIITVEQAKSQLKNLHAAKSVGEEIYREYMQKISGLNK